MKKTNFRNHGIKTTEHCPLCEYCASESKRRFAIRSLLIGLLAIATLYLPIAGYTQSLDNAIDAQLTFSGIPCRQLLDGDPGNKSLLIGQLFEICDRGTPSGGGGPSTSAGNSAGTPTMLPAIVQQRLREAHSKEKKPKTKTPAASSGAVAQIGERLNLFYSGESKNRNRIASTLENGHNSDIWRVTTNNGTQIADRIVRPPEKEPVKILKASYPGAHSVLVDHQSDSLALPRAQAVMGTNSDATKQKPVAFEIAMSPLQITGVKIQGATANSAIIQIEADQPVVEYNTFMLPDPPRIVIDITGALFGERISRKEAGQGPIKQIRASQYRRKPEPIVRVVLDLVIALPYQVAGLPDTFRLMIGDVVTKADKVNLSQSPPVTAEKPKFAPEELRIVTEPEPPLRRSVGVWGAGEYEDLDRDRTTFEDGYDSDIWRVTIGGDYQFTEKILAGLAFDYYNHDGNYDRGGDFNNDSYGFLGFGVFRPFDRTFLQVGAGYAHKDYKRERAATFTQFNSDGTVNFSTGKEFGTTKANGDYDADEVRVNALAAYDFSIGSITLSPRAGIDYRHIYFDTYSETGSTGLELTVHDDDQKWFQSRLGLQTSFAFSTPFGRIVPQASFDWIHEFENDQRDVEVSFVDDTRAKRFTYQTERPDRNWYEINVGIVAAFDNQMQVFGNYRTITGHSFFDSHAATIGFRFSF